MRFLVVVFLIFSEAFGAVPSPNDMSKCLKTSVSKIDTNAIKTASKNLTKRIEGSYKNIGASYYQEAKKLAQVVNEATKRKLIDFDGIRKVVTQSFQDYKNSLTILKGTEGIKAALQKRLAEIHSLNTSRLNSIRSAADPKRIVKSVKETLTGKYEDLQSKVSEIETKFETMEDSIKKLEEFDPNTSLEDRKRAEAEIKGQANSIVESAQGVIRSQQLISSSLSASKSLSDALASAGSIEQAQAILNQNRGSVSSGTLAAHQEALNKVISGQQTFSQFKLDSNKTSQDLSVEIQKSGATLIEAQAVLNKAQNFQAAINGGFSSSLETAKAATDFLQSVRTEQAAIGSYIESGFGIVGKFEQISQSVEPSTLISAWASELVTEKEILISELTQINNALPGLLSTFQASQNILLQGMPGYTTSFTNFMNFQGQLVQARAALEEARSILEFGVGSQAVLVATEVAFSQLQPVVKCVAPWMKYITIVSLVTRGKLNFVDIFKGVTAKSSIRSCKKGIYMKEVRGCYVPKNRQLKIAVEGSKKLEKSIIRQTKSMLKLSSKVASLKILRAYVLSLN